MGDDGRFSEAMLKAINLPLAGGESMIAVSRAVLRNRYSDEEYENEFFAIFILIDEETGHIVLAGFGEFNTSSPRHSVSNSHLDNTINIMSRSPVRTELQSNSRLFQDEVKDIARSYHEQFVASLCEFKMYFGL